MPRTTQRTTQRTTTQRTLKRRVKRRQRPRDTRGRRSWIRCCARTLLLTPETEGTSRRPAASDVADQISLDDAAEDPLPTPDEAPVTRGDRGIEARQRACQHRRAVN